MDVGDVELVIQYKAGCDFPTLIQRFGRAARRPGSEAVGILLVEKKDTTAGRKGKTVGVASKEEDKDVTIVDIQQQTSPTTSTSPPGSVPELDAWITDRCHRYVKPEIAPKDPTNAKKGKAPGVIPGSAMDDFINPPPFVTCRRLIPQLYFANNKRSQFSLLLIWSPMLTELRSQRCTSPL